MADGLNRGRRTEDGGLRVGAPALRLFARATAFCFLSSFLSPLIAEDLPDPTRPPAMIAGTGAAPGAAHGQLETESRSSGLQSTIISKSRRAAIIDGKTVELGEKYGNARLTEVSEGSVVLRSAQTRRVLTLFPDVKMTQREAQTRSATPESGGQPEEISATPAAQKEEK